MILEPLLGSKNRERVLVFLHAREEGYAREISRFFDTDLSPIQNQLERLETGGVLVSRRVGRTVLYQFNPRYALMEELRALLDKAALFYPVEMKGRSPANRQRFDHRRNPQGKSFE